MRAAVIEALAYLYRQTLKTLRPMEIINIIKERSKNGAAILNMAVRFVLVALCITIASSTDAMIPAYTDDPAAFDRSICSYEKLARLKGESNGVSAWILPNILPQNTSMDKRKLMPASVIDRIIALPDREVMLTPRSFTRKAETPPITDEAHKYVFATSSCLVTTRSKTYQCDSRAMSRIFKREALYS